MRRLGLVLALAAIAVAAPTGHAAPARTAAAKPPKPPATPSLGAHAAQVEGTWEFRSLTRGGVSLAPPAATGVIVIDKGAVLAASYLEAGPGRQVGSLWEGRMVLEGDRFEVVPEKGFRYDSKATSPVVAAIPPRSTGTITVADGALSLVREDGGSVTFSGSRREQRDPDGTVIVHERTSLVPRIPENLPGREP